MKESKFVTTTIVFEPTTEEKKALNTTFLIIGELLSAIEDDDMIDLNDSCYNRHYLEKFYNFLTDLDFDRIEIIKDHKQTG